MELGIKAKLGKAFTTIPTTFWLKSANDPPVQDCIEEYRLSHTKEVYLSVEQKIKKTGKTEQISKTGKKENHESPKRLPLCNKYHILVLSKNLYAKIQRHSWFTKSCC